MGKITRLDIQIFLGEVVLTIITCGGFLLANLFCSFMDYCDRKHEKEMELARQEGCRRRAEANEWVRLRNAVRDLEKTS